MYLFGDAKAPQSILSSDVPGISECVARMREFSPWLETTALWFRRPFYSWRWPLKVLVNIPAAKMYPSAIPDAAAKLTNKDLNNNVRLLSKYDCDFTKNPSCCERYLLRDIRHVCTHCISRKYAHTHTHMHVIL